MTVVQFESQGYIFTATGELVMCVCPVCGVQYAMPKELREWCRKDPRREWYCVNGHNLHLPGKSNEELRREAEEALARERARHDQTRASLSAQRGLTTKAKNENARLKKRASAGVCPCCNRTFQQLSRHMKSQHPDFVAEA